MKQRDLNILKSYKRGLNLQTRFVKDKSKYCRKVKHKKDLQMISVLKGLVDYYDEFKIRAMPRDKKKRLDDIEDQVSVISEHIIKLLLIPDKENENNWERTVRNCFETIWRCRYYSGVKKINIQEVMKYAEPVCEMYSRPYEILSDYCEKGNLSKVSHRVFKDEEIFKDVFISETIKNSLETDKDWSKSSVTYSHNYTNLRNKYRNKRLTETRNPYK